MLGLGLAKRARSGGARLGLNPGNLLLQPDNLGAAPWAVGSGGGAVVTAGATAPDGGGAGTLDDNSAGGVLGRFQQIAITSGGGDYTASVYFKAGTSAASSMRLNFSGGTVGKAAEGVLNLATGETQWRGGAVGTAVTSTAAGGGWHRLIVTITDNASGHTALSVDIRPCFAASYTATTSAAAVGTAHVWRAQLVAGSVP